MIQLLVNDTQTLSSILWQHAGDPRQIIFMCPPSRLGNRFRLWNSFTVKMWPSGLWSQPDKYCRYRLFFSVSRVPWPISLSSLFNAVCKVVMVMLVLLVLTNVPPPTTAIIPLANACNRFSKPPFIQPRAQHVSVHGLEPVPFKLIYQHSMGEIQSFGTGVGDGPYYSTWNVMRAAEMVKDPIFCWPVSYNCTKDSPELKSSGRIESTTSMPYLSCGRILGNLGRVVELGFSVSGRKSCYQYWKRIKSHGTGSEEEVFYSQTASTYRTGILHMYRTNLQYRTPYIQ